MSSATHVRWDDGECERCGRETQIHDHGLCLVCDSFRREIVRDVVRDEFSGRVIRRVGGSRQRLHVPDDSDDPLPHCGFECSLGEEWASKHIDVFPPGYQRWCHACVAAVEQLSTETEVR